jgi:hypothetical protein
MNYYGDHRVRAAMTSVWYLSLDEGSMMAEVELYDEETDADYRVEVHFKYDVCSVCNGKGSQVNPSIDAGGLTAEDFDEDPDFREEYLQGSYDEPCSGCDGLRVEPVIDEEKNPAEVVKAVQSKIRGNHQEAAQRCLEEKYGW